MILIEKIKKEKEQYYLVIRNIGDDVINIPMGKELEEEVREFLLKELDLDGTLYGEVDSEIVSARMGFRMGDDSE